MSMSVMRKKHLNKQKLNQYNKRSIFTLYRTNTGTNNNCNCGEWYSLSCGTFCALQSSLHSRL